MTADADAEITRAELSARALSLAREQGCTCSAPAVVVHGDVDEHTLSGAVLPVEVVHSSSCALEGKRR